jgi:hypothetical protein
MTQEKLLEQLILEMRKRSILSTEDYTPTIDHYVPIRHLKYYLNIAYTIGHEHARMERQLGKKVAQIKNGKVIKIWRNGTVAAKAMGVTKGALNNTVRGIKKTCAGFQWERAQ